MLSLFLRNLFFTLLQPGLVAGLFPYWILNKKISELFKGPFNWHHYVAAFIFLVGFVIMIHCIIRFAVEGLGTLSPADPTKRLVIKGLYKYSRNPMYIGVMLMLIGEAWFFQSSSLWWYALFVFLAFNLFVMLVEEPRLRRDFGQEYTEYCKRVGRWI